MDIFDVNEEPGWFESFWSWTRDTWSRWTAPDPESLPYDRSVLRARIELCLTRFTVVRRKHESVLKQELADLVALAQAESLMAESKVRAMLDRERSIQIMALCEPHLVLLLNNLDTPPFEMAPMLAVRNILYVAAQGSNMPEMWGIRQQLLQKYNPIIAVLKVELLDQALVKAFDTSSAHLATLEWINERAPGRCWAEKLESARQAQLQLNLHPPIPSSAALVSENTYIEAPERVIELPEGPPTDSDDDSGGFPEGLGHSHDSGPTDSPIPPLEVLDFPALPTTLYPSLSLTDSSENPQLSREPSFS